MNPRVMAGALLAAALLRGSPAAGQPPRATDRGADAMLVYFGTYTRGPSKGIYVSRFDPPACSASPRWPRSP
jgi:hypothetical protein